MTGAPYFPATNGAAEKFVQTFKRAMKKSSKPPKEALEEFLLQYRGTPNASGFSPSELLNGRQIRTKIDALLPSPAHILQQQQVHGTRKSVETFFEVWDPRYALYVGPRQTKDARWVPSTVVKKFGCCSFSVKVHPSGVIWRRHFDQLRVRSASKNDKASQQATSNSSTIPDNSLKTQRSQRDCKPPERFQHQCLLQFGGGVVCA